MNDKFKIDSHKMNHHPERVAQWLEAGDDWEKAKKIYPLYIEVSSCGACNHRCIFCALDYLDYKTGSINTENYLKTLEDMAAGRVKSVMYGGEGEPLIHAKIRDFTLKTKDLGMDVAFTTNGVFMNEDFLETALPITTWLKVSIDAGTKENYAKIHRTKEEDFDTVLKNLKKAKEIKEKNNLPVTLGTQMLLIPENHQEAVTLAKIVNDIGVDYLVIKPYSQHLMSENKRDIDYEKYLYLEDELNKLSNKNFYIIFRRHTMEKYDTDTRDHPHCLAAPFLWAYIMANGDVYTCSAFLGDKRFCIGNINEKSFKEIWESEERRKNWEFIKNLDISQCRQNCRMDEVNRYLWNLKNPPEHVNFI
ncbi:radical SAM protein [Patescibacteria group bacterium]|nr:radical SAM protein [Patescibacteria group bacterium]